MEHIRSKIRTVPHWPKEGIMFRDVTTLLQDSDGLKDTVKEFVERYKDADIDVIVGIDARGFILGGVLAHEMDLGFVPVRKKGKLPPETISQEYTLEYGTDTIEMVKGSIKEGQNVLIIDDLLATGGTMSAAAKLVEKLGGNIIECAFIVDLPDIGGRKKLEQEGRKVFALVEFEGD